VHIPIDPFYLSWKAKQNGFDARFIGLAGDGEAARYARAVNAAVPWLV